jgi:hypothetical protein
MHHVDHLLEIPQRDLLNYIVMVDSTILIRGARRGS